MNARGNVAVLKVGYHQAVTLRDWHLRSSNETLGGVTTVLTGRVAIVDEFWATRPLDSAGLYMGGAWWVWRSVVTPPPEMIELKAHIQIELLGDPEARDQF